MANDHIATYLNDHLAGSVAALELLQDLEAEHADTPSGRIFADLRADVATDRQELEAVMVRLQVTESRTRKATAWLAEKVLELKLGLDDPADGALRLLEKLETLALGIEGKRALWRALATVAEEVPGLEGIDYERLLQRADDQRNRVEKMRLDAAQAALIAGS